MGAWGVGIYDNDEAADWAYELPAAGLTLVQAALSVAPNNVYIERDEANAAIAAADVVARLKSGGGERTSYAEDVVSWVAANGGVAWQPLVAPALAALDRLSSADNNELYELWAETEELGAWLLVLAEVRDRLSAA